MMAAKLRLLLPLFAALVPAAGSGVLVVPRRRPAASTAVAGAFAAPVTLPAAASTTTTKTGALRCVSFYDFYLAPHYAPYYNTTFAEIATWMNCPSFGATPATIKFASDLWAQGHKQWFLWKVADAKIFTDPCSHVQCGTVAKSGLVSDWESRVDRMIATIKTLPDWANRTFGFNLGDELMGEGTPLENVTAVARRIRAQFGHPTFIYWNENHPVFSPGANGTGCLGTARCAASPDPYGCCLNGPDGVPDVFDAVSMDMYGGELGKDGLPNPNATCLDARTEAQCVFDFMRANVYPHLKQHQRVFVVPGLYGSKADDQTDRILEAKFELYWELAVKDPLVIGIKPWHYANEHAVPLNTTDALYINQFHLGATSYPRLINSLRTKGAAIKAKHGPNSWVAAQAWLPTPPPRHGRGGVGMKTDDETIATSAASHPLIICVELLQMESVGLEATDRLTKLQARFYTAAAVGAKIAVTPDDWLVGGVVAMYGS